MKTALAHLLANVGDLRVMAARTAEADRVSRVATAGLETALLRLAGQVHPDVAAAAKQAALETIRQRRKVRRGNIAAEFRTRGSRLVALACEAEAMLAGLALRLDTDEAFLPSEEELFEAAEAARPPATPVSDDAQADGAEHG